MNARGRSRAWRKTRGPSFWVTLAGLDQQLLPSAAIPSRSSHWILNSVCCFPKARKTGFTLPFPAANISTSPSFHLWGLAPGPKRSLLQLRDASMIRAALSPELQLLRTPSSSSWIVAIVQFLCPSLPFATPRTADCRTPDFPVLYYLPSFVKLMSIDAMQPSHPRSSPSPAFNLSQHQCLSQWVGSSHQVNCSTCHLFSLLPLS